MLHRLSQRRKLALFLRIFSTAVRATGAASPGPTGKGVTETMHPEPSRRMSREAEPTSKLVVGVCVLLLAGLIILIGIGLYIHLFTP